MPYIAADTHPVHYIPIATTVLSAIFFAVLVRRYIRRGRGTHLLWWAGGVFAYGLGTLLESAITLGGNSVTLNKLWYIAGALLGGYPLAQGTVYLLLKRRTAHVLTAITVPVILVLSVLVALSPVNLEMMEAHRPTGSILGWWWIRPMTPVVNGYAALFLIGGAVLSAIRYWRSAVACRTPTAQRVPSQAAASDMDAATPASGQREPEDGSPRRNLNEAHTAANRAIGNALIAFGALLPGIGGGMAKAGLVEGLYVGEFLGIIFIWLGYGACVRRPPTERADAAQSQGEAQPA